MWHQFLTKIVKFLDPIFDKYREKSQSAPPKYTPQTLEDFIGVLRRTPKSILSSGDRNRISAIMSFDDRKVQELMIPKKDMVFVSQKEVLGPLTLDKLYKSGFTSFPVIDSKDNIKGIIHTEALNALEIKNTDRAEKYIDKTINYLHDKDSLSFAVEEIKRKNNTFFLVLDSSDSLVGCFTVQILLDYLLG